MRTEGLMHRICKACAALGVVLLLACALVTVADVVSSVSLTSGVAWYFPVVYAAYEMALAE